MRKINVLFVGAFKEKSKGGGVGGQLFACRTIIQSELSQTANWHLVDSTADTNKHIPIQKKLLKATQRMVLFLFFIITKKIDIVLIFTADGTSFIEKGTLALIAKILFNKRVIIAPRSGYIVNDLSNKGFLSLYIPFVIKKCDYVICQSEIWKNLFQKLTEENNSKKFVTIVNWIPIEEYIEIPFVYSSEVPTILFLSWLERNKGVFELIDAVKKLKKDKLNFKLIIAGKGKDNDEIKKIICDEGLNEYIEMVGWVLGSEKKQLLEKTDIYVLPSYYEGYPNSLIEAMASGKACIATNVGSISEIIENNTNGLLITPRNSEELYEGIKQLIINKGIRLKLSKNARASVTKNNNSINGVNNYKKIFELCVE